MIETNIFTIKIADINISIYSRNDSMRSFCKKYICIDKPDFIVKADDMDIDKERELMIGYLGRSDATEEELERNNIYRQIAEKLPTYGAFLIHATAVCVDGDAYLLAGPSGAGKTTHAKLWKKEFGERMRVINDDKPLLRVVDDKIVVYSSPWSGKERWYNNISAPLKAIIFVNQAKENYIEPINRMESWNYVMNQTYRSTETENMKRTLEFVDKLISMVPIYSLHCNKEQDSVLVAYKTVSEKQI